MNVNTLNFILAAVNIFLGVLSGVGLCYLAGAVCFFTGLYGLYMENKLNGKK
jgi:ABC-type antimicrobial peptide transport system permease subunit